MRRVREAPPKADRATEVERLYREDGARLWRAILAFTGDPDTTSDVVAEAFAQLLRRGDAVRSPQRWVWRAAFRIAGGQLKERRREAPVTLDQVQVSPERALEVVLVLQALPPRQRSSVILRYYLGYTPREIASILGVAPPTVRVHLTRGLRKLRSLLEETNDEG